MSKFTDGSGRRWEIAGTLLTWERVKRDAGVDMLTLTTTQECLRAIDDPYTLARVLYACVADQAESGNVTPEQFAAGLTADALSEASDALIEAAIFFCRSRLRPALTAAHRAAKAREEKEIQRIEKSLPHIEAQMERALASMETPIDSATSSAESSESTPEAGRSATSFGPARAGKKKPGSGRRR